MAVLPGKNARGNISASLLRDISKRGMPYRPGSENFSIHSLRLGGSMSAIFDPLEYFEKLKTAGLPEEQARLHANAFRDFSKNQDENYKKELAARKDLLELNANLGSAEANLQKNIEMARLELQKEIKALELLLRNKLEQTREELRKEIRELEIRLRNELEQTKLTLKKEMEQSKEELRKEILQIKLDMRKENSNLRLEMKAIEIRLLKWQWGIALALAAIMAKGFNWLGF